MYHDMGSDLRGSDEVLFKTQYLYPCCSRHGATDDRLGFHERKSSSKTPKAVVA